MVGPGLSMGRWGLLCMVGYIYSSRTQKVVVCGARGCGKTSVLEKLIYGNNGPYSSKLWSTVI